MSGRTPPDTHPKELSRRRTNLGSSQLPEADPMQILHPFAGSLQQYTERLADPDCYRPGHCPQCHAKQPLTAHGFYTRTLDRLCFRWRHSRSPLLVPRLPAHRLPAARVHLALPAVEPDGDCAVPGSPSAGRANDRGRRPQPHRRLCPTSAASSGFAAFVHKPKRCAPHWPR